MRCYFFLGALLGLSACKPDITGGTYYCGPEALCPPNLECQFGNSESFSFDCVNPRSVEPFACAEITSDREPDNDRASALELGVLTCGGQFQFADRGCIADGEDRDHYRFSRQSICVGSNPRFKASLRYPLGAVPLKLSLLDEAGQEVARGELCTPELDTSGTELRCIEEADLPVGEYVLRVEIDENANADCAGDCRFNHYQLFVSEPVS